MCEPSIQFLSKCLLLTCLHPGKGLVGRCSLVWQSDRLKVLNEDHFRLSLCPSQAITTNSAKELCEAPGAATGQG